MRIKFITITLPILVVGMFALKILAQPPQTEVTSPVKIITYRNYGTLQTNNPDKSCCPPFNIESRNKMLILQGNGLDSSGFLTFCRPGVSLVNSNSNDTAKTLQQMQAYLTYLRTIDSSINSIVIAFSLFDNAVSATNPMGNQIGQTITLTLTSTTNGNPIFSPNFQIWNNVYTFTPVSGNNCSLQAGNWYRINTKVYLGDGKTFFPESCSGAISDKYLCSGSCVLQKGVKEKNTLVMTDDGKNFEKNPKIQIIDRNGKPNIIKPNSE